MPTEPFVPLTIAPAPTARHEFRVLVAERPERAQAFRPQSASTAHAVGAQGANPACEARVTLQREGDHVTAIHIQCSCGQHIELACVYSVKT